MMFPYQELLKSLELDLTTHGIREFDAPISSDMGVSEIQGRMLHRSFYKKLEPEGMSEEAIGAGLIKFLSINNSISTDPFEFPVVSEQDSLFWDYFQDNFLKALTPCDANFDLEYIRETFAVGPGASMGCKNESFYTKLFNSTITFSHPHLLTLYRGAIVESDTWSFAERERHVKFGESLVASNRLFFVPKTTEITRTCCTEPLLNMLMQQALGAFLCDCLERSFGISLKTQPDHNRELARIGSLDGSFGTIDLQSASDSISMQLVQRIACHTGLLGWFKLFRSEFTELPGGEKIALNMISTMGNGFTFPLQTIIFACSVRAVYQMMGLDSSCPKTQFGVFGDDIIVRKEAYGFLCQMLTKLGFKVNDTKSFNTGSFRESCGYDWYNGHFVRGVYIRKLETDLEVYSAINRLTRWSASTGVSLVNTVRYLKGSLRRKALLVPFSETIDCGIQVPFNLTIPKVTNSYWFSYRKLIKKSRKLKVPEDITESRLLGYSHFNANGWGVTFLGGFAHRMDRTLNSEHSDPQESRKCAYPMAYIMPREAEESCHMKVVSGSIPFWDWQKPKGRMGPTWKHEAYTDDPFRFFSYASWERSVAGNL